MTIDGMYTIANYLNLLKWGAIITFVVLAVLVGITIALVVLMNRVKRIQMMINAQLPQRYTHTTQQVRYPITYE